MTQIDNTDLDWSHVNETVKLLAVSVTQVETSMLHGDNSINTLTASFTSMVQNMNAINELLNEFEACDNKETAIKYCNEMLSRIQSSIVAFQFYDRLQQSLSHVVESLKGLSTLVVSPDRLYNPEEWLIFQDEIRSRFTMESEKAMFDAIIQGKSIEEAIQLAAQADNSDDERMRLNFSDSGKNDRWHSISSTQLM